MSESDGIAKDVREQVKELIEQLEKTDISYFGKDRNKQLKAKIEDITQLLDSTPIEFSKFIRFSNRMTSPKQERESGSIVLKGQSSRLLAGVFKKCRGLFKQSH